MVAEGLLAVMLFSHTSVSAPSAWNKLSHFCINSWDEAVQGVSFLHKTLPSEASNTITELIVAVKYFPLEISLFL